MKPTSCLVQFCIEAVAPFKLPSPSWVCPQVWPPRLSFPPSPRLTSFLPEPLTTSWELLTHVCNSSSRLERPALRGLQTLAQQPSSPISSPNSLSLLPDFAADVPRIHAQSRNTSDHSWFLLTPNGFHSWKFYLPKLLLPQVLVSCSWQ